MDTNLIIDKINILENILVNNQGKNDNMIKFGLNEIKSMIINFNSKNNNITINNLYHFDDINISKFKDNIGNIKLNSNNSEIKRLNEIIEEKNKKINELTNELNSLKMNDKKNIITNNGKLGCQHFKKVNVFVKCFKCKEFYPCYNCHDIIQNHIFIPENINKCRFCNTIFNNNLSNCPTCNVMKNISD